MSKNKDLANIYFDAFSKADLVSVRNFLSDDVSLRDWILDVSGIESVLKVYNNMFQSLSNIGVNVLRLYEIEDTVIAELIITATEIGSIKVVDILSFDKNGKIYSIRAYKGQNFACLNQKRLAESLLCWNGTRNLLFQIVPEGYWMERAGAE